MLGDITIAKEVYLACGYTDMRKSIDGLAAVVQQQFHLNPFQPALFLFCGKRCDRLKALLWEGDGFVLLYKRLESGRFQWPRTESECRPITWQEFRWLMEGLQIEQKSAIKLNCTLCQGQILIFKKKGFYFYQFLMDIHLF